LLYFIKYLSLQEKAKLPAVQKEDCLPLMISAQIEIQEETLRQMLMLSLSSEKSNWLAKAEVFTAFHV
jgi:hypothetical protein